MLTDRCAIADCPYRASLELSIDGILYQFCRRHYLQYRDIQPQAVARADTPDNRLEFARYLFGHGWISEWPGEIDRRLRRLVLA